MRTQNLPTVRKTFAVQGYDMDIALPFAANYDKFLNVSALAEIGVDALGVARQLDQVTVENVRNNAASRFKTAAKKGLPAPTQTDIDNLILAYDFTGARASSEAGMSSDERTLFSEIKKYCRRAFVDKVFNQGGFFVTRIQTAKEAEELAAKQEAGEEVSVLKGTLPLDEFNDFVQAAFDGTEVEVADAEGNAHTINFADNAWQSWLQPARDEAERIIAKNKVGAVAPAPLAV
jgi:hypothetical protein